MTHLTNLAFTRAATNKNASHACEHAQALPGLQLWINVARMIGYVDILAPARANTTSTVEPRRPNMPMVQEMRRSDSLDFQNEKKVVVLRGTRKYAWADVRNSVVTMAGNRPSIRTCQRIYASYNKKLGRRVFKFAKCGRRRWKVTRGIEVFVVRRLRALRQTCICTSTTLQRELKKTMGVVLECSTIRRILARHGYRWRARGQNPL